MLRSLKNKSPSVIQGYRSPSFGPQSNQQGMALLLTISLVSILAIVTLQFSKTMRQEYIISSGLKNSVRLGEMARSGILIAEEILLLDEEENTFDSFHDFWALLADEDLSALFAQGTLTVSVTDETGKFQINGMVVRKTEEKTAENAADDKKQQEHEHNVRNILWRLLREEPFLVEDGDARGIIDSLIDWIDSGDGDGEEEYGAEDSYYQSLDPPYSCKNGPIESIEELLLVKGFSHELLYGTEEIPALAPLLTALGDTGKININTAELPLLQALANDLDKTIAESMISFREDENNKEQLETAQWFRDVPSFPSDIADAIQEQNLITTTGSYFTISATAEFNSQQKTITATVERSDQEISILRWHSE